VDGLYGLNAVGRVPTGRRAVQLPTARIGRERRQPDNQQHGEQPQAGRRYGAALVIPRCGAGQGRGHETATTTPIARWPAAAALHPRSAPFERQLRVPSGKWQAEATAVASTKCQADSSLVARHSQPPLTDVWRASWIRRVHVTAGSCLESQAEGTAATCYGSHHCRQRHHEGNFPMKPSHWLDLVDIAIRVLSIVRHLLTELWSGQGSGDGVASEE